jgi:hypothetical protein
LALVAWFIAAAEALAQLRTLPPSPAAPRQHHGGRRTRVVVSGFIGNGFLGPPIGFVGTPYFPGPFVATPYGVFEARRSIQVIVPATYVQPWPYYYAPEVDLAGADLDAGPPPWVNDRALRIVGPFDPPEPGERAKQIEPPKPLPPPPAPREAPELFPPKADPFEESQRLQTLGIEAFYQGEYGVAARRFIQALDADPASARAHFLLSQAFVALGKFRDAVQTIGIGLSKDPAWPTREFRPRFELYRNQPADWAKHRTMLEEASERQPNNAGYHFLLAYLRWFDDDRAIALKLFREVRPLVADPALVDLFVKAAP